ncbi:hypothetical protein [Psychromonas arctica]|uniref:hypothetical protein n=1 Tax=Psychromonas arctica TaxID=168275 RepID=UPI002FD6EDA4
MSVFSFIHFSESFNDTVFDKEITDEKQFNKDTANTGLYLYPLKLEYDRSAPINNLKSKIALKLNRKGSSVFYSYIVDFDKRKGQVIKQVKDLKVQGITFQTLNIVSQPYRNNEIVSG